MAILQSTLREYAARSIPLQKSAAIVEAARIAKKQTAFLSHSHADAQLAKGVQGFLQANGWDVYIDWEDMSMPSSPNRQTAEKIQRRIRALDWFLFLATANSMSSRWCPWELGYADGVKEHDVIRIIPTSDSVRTHGSEYLSLYKHIDYADGGGVGSFDPTNRGHLISSLRL